MGAPRHGKNGLIYVSGTELAGSNMWRVAVDTDTAESTAFGEQWKGQHAGLSGWSGSLTANDHDDLSLLFDAATAGAAVALLIYPVRAELGDYYSGNAIFSYGSEGSTTAVVSNTANFTGHSTLTQAGFS